MANVKIDFGELRPTPPKNVNKELGELRLGYFF